jgi:dynein heavy chain
MASGYLEAALLASKFFCLYSLLKELLSKANHYEWGLRSVKTVLYVAGQFRREDPDMGEQELLMRALRDSNTPKIVDVDEVVFHGLLKDLFPGMDPPRKLYEEREVGVVKAFEFYQLEPQADLCQKTVELEELCVIRHSNFIMGPPMAGKSVCIKTCVKMREYMGDPTMTRASSPQSVKTVELYGVSNLATRDWTDGMMSIMMRDLAGLPDEYPPMKHDGSPGSKWILLDGDLDANWIESMNSVMDDNRMLTLPNNERIPLKPHMKLIFELRDLVHATPATASRAGVIFIPTAAGHQWKSILTAWLRNNAKQPWANDKSLVQMRALFDEYIPATVLWKKINVQSVVPLGKAYNYDDAQSCQILLWMLDELLRPYHGEDPELMEQLFVFCMIWSFGSMLTITDAGFDCRKCFSDWWRSEWKNVKIPSRDTVFDYWLDPESNTLDTWTKSPFFYEVTFDSTTTNMSTVTVPTPETAGVAVGERAAQMLAVYRKTMPRSH